MFYEFAFDPCMRVHEIFRHKRGKIRLRHPEKFRKLRQVIEELFRFLNITYDIRTYFLFENFLIGWGNFFSGNEPVKKLNMSMEIT